MITSSSWPHLKGERAPLHSTLSRVTRVGFANCSASGNYEAFRMDEVDFDSTYSDDTPMKPCSAFMAGYHRPYQ
jgi:hypothetical protein